MTAPKKRDAWECSDGKILFDPVAAEVYQENLDIQALIDQFLDEGAEYTDRGTASAQRIITDFCKWASLSMIHFPWDEPGPEEDPHKSSVKSSVKSPVAKKAGKPES